jgi:polyisoprenoid-binding protein YceI
MKTRTRTILTVAAVITLLVAAGDLAATQKTYHFGVSGQRTNITFESHTDFEVILGSTNALSGMAQADFDSGEATVKLEVPVASLRTGIDLRDQHLRSPMWLNADQHPTISFVSKKARRLDNDRWEVTGDFTLHGVTRTLKTVVSVREIPGDLAKKAGLEAGEWVRVSAPFEVDLSEFGVQIPDMAAAKVNDTWNIRVVAFASTVGGGAANPCNPCGGKSAKKAANPCNPCGGKSAKKATNPCNPCNPCGGKDKPHNPCNPCGGKK